MYVRAVADYVTSEPNLLSFQRGDVIQLAPRVQEEYSSPGKKSF